MPTSAQAEGNTGQFQALPVPAMPAHYVGRNANGFPCILLKSSDNTVRAPVKLANLDIFFDIPCKILIENRMERQEVLTVVVCTSPDLKTQEYFLHICETIFHLVGPTPSLSTVNGVVQRLINLFQQLSRPAKKPVIGLIGELYVISRSRCPATAVRAWRCNEDDRFDFAVDNVRLEVKASGNRTRSHNFSLEQCILLPGIVGILVSLFIENSGGGLSLIELIHRIESRLKGDHELILKLKETVVQTLGETLNLALEIRFDDALAKSSLLFYDLSMIPAIRSEIPGSVSRVRFSSDLSHTEPLTLKTAVKQSSQLNNILPPM